MLFRIFIILLIGLVVGCAGSEQNNSKNEPDSEAKVENSEETQNDSPMETDKKSILFFGNSLTAGAV